jgi:hypothetical protein
VPNKEVTDSAGETKDMAAGVKTATAVDNEVNHGVGEKEVMIASEKPQQGPESEIATTVYKDDANEKKNTDARDPSQKEQAGASKDSQKKTTIRDNSS